MGEVVHLPSWFKIHTPEFDGREITEFEFKQLIEGPFYADDGNLIGQPLCYVKLHNDDCDCETPHCHVIWQYGDELRKWAVHVDRVREWGLPRLFVF